MVKYQNTCCLENEKIKFRTEKQKLYQFIFLDTMIPCTQNRFRIIQRILLEGWITVACLWYPFRQPSNQRICLVSVNFSRVFIFVKLELQTNMKKMLRWHINASFSPLECKTPWNHLIDKKFPLSPPIFVWCWRKLHHNESYKCPYQIINIRWLYFFCFKCQIYTWKSSCEAHDKN